VSDCPDADYSDSKGVNALINDADEIGSPNKDSQYSLVKNINSDQQKHVQFNPDLIGKYRTLYSLCPLPTCNKEACNVASSSIRHCEL